MEKSSFFNSVDHDRVYNADDFCEYLTPFFANGVFMKEGNALQVIANDDMSVTVSPGLAFIEGKRYENTDNLNLKIDNADGVSNRIDNVVIQLDYLGRIVKTRIIKGEFSASAVAPVLKRNTDYFELLLAKIAINKGITKITQSMITDTRLDETVCGIVYNPLDHIDSTTLYNQIQSDLAEFKNVSYADFEAWFVDIKKIWDAQTTNYENQIVNNQNTFDNWLSSIQGILDEDALGHLLSLIKDSSPIGEVKQYAGDTPPTGYLLCQGQEVSRVDYADLFSVIGEKFGSGDGTTTFNIPDMRQKVAVGASDTFALASSGGENEHQLTLDELPAHTHGATGSASSAGAHGHTASTSTVGAHAHSVSATAASAGAHEHSVQVRGAGRKAGCAGGGYGYFLDNLGPASASPDSGDLYAFPAGAHTHSVSGTAASNGNHAHTVTVVSNGAHTHGISVSVASVGGNKSHNNMQEYLVLNYIIKY